MGVGSRSAVLIRIPGLEKYRYGLVSSFIKSMRLSKPKDAFYYYNLLRQTPDVDDNYIHMRLLIACAEDSVSADVMTTAANWWPDHKSNAGMRLGEALIHAVATHPNAYRIPHYVESYSVSAWVKETHPRSPKKVEQLLSKWEPTGVNRADWTAIQDLFLSAHVYEGGWTLAQYDEMVAEFAIDMADRVWHNKILRDWALAYQKQRRVFARLAAIGGDNWSYKLLFAAISGITPTDKPIKWNAEIRAIKDKARERAAEDLRKHRIFMPSYAFDGRHCYMTGVVRDARFCGDGGGVRNMEEMTKRDGWQLDPSKQGVLKHYQAPVQCLTKPFIRFTVNK